MGLRAPELLVVLSPHSGSGLTTLGGRLLVVVPSAQRTQVRVAVVVATLDVVNVRGRFLAALAVDVAPRAAVAVTMEDASAGGGPVRRKLLAAV